MRHVFHRKCNDKNDCYSSRRQRSYQSRCVKPRQKQNGPHVEHALRKKARDHSLHGVFQKRLHREEKTVNRRHYGAMETWLANRSPPAHCQVRQWRRCAKPRHRKGEKGEQLLLFMASLVTCGPTRTRLVCKQVDSALLTQLK